jgi:hypothetical protein
MDVYKKQVFGIPLKSNFIFNDSVKGFCSRSKRSIKIN